MRENSKAKSYALSEKDFWKLVEACRDTAQVKENRFLILVMGIPGLRVGETVHMRRYWVDFEREVITIPRHQPCSCSYCKSILKKKHGRNDIAKGEIMEEQWHPKSDAAVRSIPFGFSQDVKHILKLFFSKHRQWPYSVSSIGRRIKHVTRLAGLENIYPHRLRAMAAYRFIDAGVDPIDLCKIMGWDFRSLHNHNKGLNGGII